MAANGDALSGIGRRRGAAANGKSARTSLVVFLVAFCLTLVVGRVVLWSPTTGTPRRAGGPASAASPRAAGAAPPPRRDRRRVGDAGDDDALARILRAELHLVDIDASGMTASAGKEGDADARYRGVTASFCRLQWERYKSDPPSLPMFKMLVAASGCDRKKNLTTVDLADVVRRAREADRAPSAATRALPPAGFVFHESRVGSTLAANALAAMDPAAHRVYSEAHPINDALKACAGRPEAACGAAANAALLRDVVYLLGRTDAPTERRAFFKVSSVGAKRIAVLQRAFPAVPWIFVHRDPVQTMMSHLDPAKLGRKGFRGGVPPAVCLRAQKRPPPDLVALARDKGRDVAGLSYQEFCAAHLATLCWSAVRGLRAAGSQGLAVEYEGLVDRLITTIIPEHFGVPVDAAARGRIRAVATRYSKSKGDARAWTEDSGRKEAGATPEIRAASAAFLADAHAALQGRARR